MTTRPRIPMSLITGFLGSGKTTLLRRLIETQASRRIVYIINEFGSVDVDGRSLNLHDEQWVSMPGGSIFCACLAGEFIHHLLRISHAGRGREPSWEGVLIEASGIADPRVVTRMIAEARLEDACELRRIIAVIDPGTFPKLLHTLPNVTAQVEACDLAIINKTDLYNEKQITWTEDAVRRINAGVELKRAALCEVEFDPWSSAQLGEIMGELAPCVDPRYARLVIRLDRPVAVEALQHELEALQSAVYRIKGWVDTLKGRYQVDVAAGVTTLLQSVRAGKGQEESLLVCIFAPESRANVEAFGARATSGKLNA